MSNDKIVNFPGTEPLPANLIETNDPQRFKFCKSDHGSIMLDEHLRTVTCRDCGKVLDPFDFLKQNARTLQRAWQNHASAKQKVSELMDRIETLNKELVSVQGKVRRAKEKLPPESALDVRGSDKL